jgi:hypothetical protein
MVQRHSVSLDHLGAGDRVRHYCYDVALSRAPGFDRIVFAMRWQQPDAVQLARVNNN